VIHKLKTPVLFQMYSSHLIESQQIGESILLHTENI